MKKEDNIQEVIMLGIQPWDIEIGSNFKNMALEIAKNSRVLYVNRPLDRITSWIKKSDHKTINRKNSIKKGIGVLNEIEKDLWIFNPQTILESINWLPKGKLYTYLNKRNNHLLADEIKKAATTLNFKNPLLIIDNDFYNGLYLKEYLQISHSMYYLRDYLLSQPYFYKHGVRAEPAIMAKSDIVVTNSTYLADYAHAYNKNTFYIGQGCEVEEFEKQPTITPADISIINKPVIGYCGALLSLRLDINLLISIAEQRPYWNIVLVGPEDADFKKSKLHSMKNVFFLGAKDPAQLPGYVHCFDVCLNPQVVNQMTIGNYPRKIDEYLAAGKPTVATATKTMEAFADSVTLCNSAQEYIAAIDVALQEADDTAKAAKRRAVARSHTWANSIAQLFEAYNHYEQKKSYESV